MVNTVSDAKWSFFHAETTFSKRGQRIWSRATSRNVAHCIKNVLSLVIAVEISLISRDCWINISGAMQLLKEKPEDASLENFAGRRFKCNNIEGKGKKERKCGLIRILSSSSVRGRRRLSASEKHANNWPITSLPYLFFLSDSISLFRIFSSAQFCLVPPTSTLLLSRALSVHQLTLIAHLYIYMEASLLFSVFTYPLLSAIRVCKSLLKLYTTLQCPSRERRRYAGKKYSQIALRA